MDSPCFLNFLVEFIHCYFHKEKKNENQMCEKKMCAAAFNAESAPKPNSLAAQSLGIKKWNSNHRDNRSEE